MNSIKALERILTTSRHIANSAMLGRTLQRRTLTMTASLCHSSDQAADDVLFERVGGAGIITLNRPAALNALNLSMINKIHPQIKKWEEDPSTTMIIMKGAGEKAFCAGGDVRTITDAAKQGNFKAGQDFFHAEYMLNYSIATCQVPYIALIDGVTMGGGVGLSVHGSDRICTERTLFAMPETAIGLFPDVGGSHFLPRLSLHLGMYLALTGYRLKGRDVYKAGVATRMVSSAVLPEVEQALVALQNPQPQEITDLLRKYHIASKIGRERDYLILRDREEDIKRHFLHDSVEKIFQSLESDGSEWALEQLATLSKMSPTSLKVTHRQLHLGESMDLDECLEMEYSSAKTIGEKMCKASPRCDDNSLTHTTIHIQQPEKRIGCRCLRNHDFAEGVRAMLVDRDRAPRWKPATLREAPVQLIDSYFAMVDGVAELELN